MAERRLTANEARIVKNVDLVEYYNKVIYPIVTQSKAPSFIRGKKSRNFALMHEERKEALCPFHEDSDPSFRVWGKANIFRCFGCQYGGNVIQTHIKMRKEYFGETLDAKAAVRQLGAMYKIALDEETGDHVESPFERAKSLMAQKKYTPPAKDSFSPEFFRTNNNRVKRANVPIAIKVQNFAQLDLIAALALGNKEGD